MASFSDIRKEMMEKYGKAAEVSTSRQEENTETNVGSFADIRNEMMRKYATPQSPKVITATEQPFAAQQKPAQRTATQAINTAPTQVLEKTHTVLRDPETVRKELLAVNAEIDKFTADIKNPGVLGALANAPQDDVPMLGGGPVRSESDANDAEKMAELQRRRDALIKEYDQLTGADDRTWFQKGAFEDGYQRGDILKAAAGTAGDAAENAVAGGASVVESFTDSTAYLGGNGVDWLGRLLWGDGWDTTVTVGQMLKNKGAPFVVQEGNSPGQQVIANAIAQDLIDEKATAKTLVSDPLKAIIGVDTETDSILGEKSDALMQSAGQLAAQYGLSLVGVPWFVTSGVSSFGSETESALQQGATLDEAATSAAITAGAEILTEKLFGGDLFVKNAGFDALTDTLTKGITNKFIRKAAQLGLDAAGEGAEEWVSQRIGQFGQWLTYKHDEKELLELMYSEESLNEALESFFGGVALGGGMGTVKAVMPNAAPQQSQTAPQTNTIAQAENTQATQEAAAEPAPGSLEWVQELSDLGRGTDTVSNQTNAVSKPLSSYPAEKQHAIRSYLSAVDQKIKNFVQKVKSGDLTFKREKISDVSERAAVDIGKLLGIDVSGYTNNINTNGVQHIIDRHGKNGEHDSTMAIDDDIARIGWVLENYDTVELLTEKGKQVYSSEFRDNNNRPAPQIRFIKKIDGTHYVVEAACENKYKKLWVQGTYLQKNEDVTQAPAEGQKTNHETNAQSDLASPSSINSISQTAPGVNTNSSQAAQPDAIAQVQELLALGQGKENGQTVDTETQAEYDNENDTLLYEPYRPGQDIKEFDHDLWETGKVKAAQDYNLTDTESFGVDRYVGGAAYEWNAVLRGDENYELSEYYDFWIQQAAAAFKKFPQFQGRTYRNLTFDSRDILNKFLTKHEMGKTVIAEQFLSASKDPNGYVVSGDHIVHMVIDGIGGRDISDTYSIPGQQEVVYIPGTTLYITAVKIANDGNPLIYAKEVIDNGKNMETDNHGDGQGPAGTINARSEGNVEGKGHDLGGVYGNRGMEGNGGARDARQIQQSRDTVGYGRLNPAESVGAAPGNHAVGAAEQNFTGRAAYQDLLSDENSQRDRPGDVRPVEVPKVDGYGRNISEFVGNAYGSEVVPDNFTATIEELVQEGALGYDTKTNAESLHEAAQIIKKKGMASARNAITKNIANGKVGNTDVATAMLLFNQYAHKNGQQAQDSAAELFVDLQMMATQTGRDLQMFKMLRKMTPQGQLMAVTKNVDRYVQNINERRGRKNQVEVSVPTELTNEYMEAAQDAAVNDTPENQQRKLDAEQAIYEYAAANIPATMQEKWDAWRYMAMLGNPKTQIRNVMGNGLFRPFVEAKRYLGAAIESVFLEQDQRTKSALGFSESDRALLYWARKDSRTADTMQRMEYTATTGDAAVSEIGDRRQIFKPTALEKARTGLNDLMSAEDMWFKRGAYSTALASFLKARGVTAQHLQDGSVDSATLNAARNYAVKEAMKATFNDQNAVSNFVANKLRYKGNNKFGKILNAAAEGILPFRRTPANIALRGLEYSPLGLGKTLLADTGKLRNGEVTAAEYIDNIAAGLTGSAAMALGYALASGIFEGLRLVGNEDDEDEKRTGHNSYALEVGNVSIPVDWAAPAVLPLFMGANLYDSLNPDGENVSTSVFTGILDACANTLEPMLELSCLSSLNDLITDARYAEQGRELYAIAASAATSYFMQGLPTLFGQVEQAFETEKKSIYADSSDPVISEVQQILGRATQKIPTIDLYQTEKVDAWGRTEEKGVAERIFDAFINPANDSRIVETKADIEIKRLNRVQDENVSPDTPAKKLTFKGTDGKTYTDRCLTGAEYVALAKLQGQTQKQLVEDIISNSDYADLSDEDKASAIRYAYDYARDSARGKVVEDHPGITTKWMKELKGDIAEGIIRHIAADGKYTSLSVSDASYVDDLLDGLIPEKGKTNVRDIQRIEAVADSKLSEKDQKAVLKDTLSDSAYAKYLRILATGVDTDDYATSYRLYLDAEGGTGKKARIISSFQNELDVSYSVAVKLYDIYSGKK